MSRRVRLRGKPEHDSLEVDAMTRRGRRIRCRVIVHAVGDGEEPSGAVIVMEELRKA